MDKVYDENGTPHKEQTHLFVPNCYIVDLAKKNDRVLFGASIHPYRSDWSQELDYCLENRAVLCKWIPSSQLINPAHPKCIPFYKKLADHQLPLLCHAGPEYGVPTWEKAYDEFNNPKYFRTALDQGVPVIIAHCSLPYFWLMDVDYTDDFDEFLKLFKDAEKNEWNLYSDLSAICTPLRSPYIDDIKRDVPVERLLFGSDFPHPLLEIYYNRSKGFYSWLRLILKVAFMKNPLDKNYLVIKEMEFGNSIFANASSLFAKIRY